jgi:hypothetical protein
LTHNGTSLILPGSASITTAANDVAGFRSLGSGNWQCEWYQRASGSALSTAASSITGQVSVANGGTGASTLTANNVILGNGTSAVQFVAPGTTGNILTSNGTTWTSTAPASSSKLVQQVISTSSALASGAGTIPFDDTIPQNTEGNEFLTVSITPTSASNYLMIEVNALLSNSTGNSVIGAIFQDSTANALAATSNTPPNVGSGQFFVLRHRMTAGTTSSTTLKFRAGAIAAATTYLNANSSGTRLFGGVAASLITVTEIAP